MGKNLRVKMKVLLMMVVAVITNRTKVTPRRKLPVVVFVAALKNGNAVVQIFRQMKMAQVQVKNGERNAKAKADDAKRSYRTLKKPPCPQTTLNLVAKNGKRPVLLATPNLLNFPKILKLLLESKRLRGTKSSNLCGLTSRTTICKILRTNSLPNAMTSWKRSSAKKGSNVSEWPNTSRNTCPNFQPSSLLSLS